MAALDLPLAGTFFARSAGAPMREIRIEKASGTPLSQQIASGIREAIHEGGLAPGERLPAERALARSLGVDRMTVARAYDELVRLGLILRHVGRGSFVAEPARRDPPGPEHGVRPFAWSDALSARALRSGGGPVATFHAPPPEDAVNFSSHFPDPSLFPVAAFRKAIDLALAREGTRLLGYGPASGYPPLRRYLADSMRQRGVTLTEEEIIVTNGSQQGIDLVARALLDPGDRVIMENPTYTGAAQVFQWYGAEVTGVPVDEQGMRPEKLEAALGSGGAKLVYLIPNFQNPTSGTMELARRRRLLEIAERRRLPILEDDFGGDLRYEGRQVPSLKALDRSGVVVYVNSFAKKLLPGLRIGWMAAPAGIAERLIALKQITDWSTSLLLQGALHQFCESGQLERHLKRVLPAYRDRRNAMLTAMKRYFPAGVKWTRPEGGFVVWVTLPPGIDADEVALEARGKGVLVSRGDLFYVDAGTHNNLRLVFAQAEPAEIRRGIRTLGTILNRKVKDARAAVAAGVPEPLPII